MKKYQRIYIIILLLVVILLTGFSLEHSKFISVSMYGYRISADGQPIEEIDFKLSASKKISIEDNELKSFDCKVQFSESKEVPFANHTLGFTFHPEDGNNVYYISGLGYVADLNSFANISIYLNKNLTNCLMVVNRDRYYICSVDPNFDIDSVWAEYTQYLSHIGKMYSK